MATGFQSRWLGKVLAKQFWLNGTKVTPSGADLNTQIGASVVAAASTVTALLSSSAGITTIGGTSLTYTLPAPVVGVHKLYDTALAASTSLLRRLYTGSASILFDSTNTVLSLSSSAGIVELVGVTTAKWGVVQANGGALGTAT